MRLADWINRFEEGAIALLLAAMTLITFSQVVARYVFNSGAVWALELTTYLFAWLVLFGASYCVKVGAHIGVDVLVRKLSPDWQRTFGLIATALCMAFSALMLIGGWRYIDTLRQIGIEAEDLPVPEWQLKIILPLGFALLLFRFAEVGWKILTGREGGLRMVDEAAEARRGVRDNDAPPDEGDRR